MQKRIDLSRGAMGRAALALCAACSLTLAGGCNLFRGWGEPSRASQERARAQERVDLAEQLREEGRIEEALAELALAIRDNPKMTTAFVQMADIHKERGDYGQAERAYARASELEPSNFDYVFNHGLMLQLLNRLTEAVRVYLRALALRPDDRDANLNLATAYLQLREPRQALPYAQRAVQIDPSHAPARVNLGAVFGSLDRHREAVMEFESALETGGESPELLLNLADSLNRLNRHAEMATTLERLIAIAPNAPGAALAHERLGSARFRLGRYDEALASFRRAVEIDPMHYPALNGIGVCLLNRYLTSEPRDAEAQRDAVRALRRSLQINERQPRIVELLSRYG